LEKLTEECLIPSPTAIDPLTMEGYEIVMNFLKTNKDYFTSLLPELGEIIKKRTEIGDVAEIYADTSLANNLLNWRAKRTLRDMCHDNWQWQLKLNGN
jgi:UDP-glucose 4-epimerase